jgi:peptidoglycan/xylan/chitin deacetylase (PgdA/CDA1 family)
LANLEDGAVRWAEEGKPPDLAGIMGSQTTLSSRDAETAPGAAAFKRSSAAVRRHAKFLAYGSGAIGLFHRLRDGECLTVVMLHRVLPVSEADRLGADPVYTITPELLSGTVEFLKQNYSIVGVRDVLSSLRRERPLPRCPLLITFDDGWRDNLLWALPSLRGTPWTLFAAADILLERECWWQEVVLSALRSGQTNVEELWTKAAAFEPAADPLADREDTLGLLLRYAELLPETRHDVLAPYERSLRADSRHMLTSSELMALRREGIEIGSHGASHLPLTRVPDPAEDLRRSLELLKPFGCQPILSFPHGRYDEKVTRAARKVGFAAMFTSDPILNPCPGGWLKNDVIGRIPLNSATLCNRDDAFAPQQLAAHLFTREIGS